VIASTRLFAREGVLAVRSALSDAVDALLGVARDHERTPMAGRTHLQPAMPSTVGLWSASFAEALLDADAVLEGAYRQLNRSPLGAAASYGVPLPLDREQVAELLGFAGVHHNVLWAVTSRGQVELAVLDALDQIGLVLSRLATDLILFTLPEFGYFSLPPELCSGSSIMPQKRNPDGLELLRGKSGVLSSYADRLRGIVRSLPSAYNRDVQETKEPLLRGIDLAIEMLAVAGLTARRLTVHPERLRVGMTAELFATDAAIGRVVAGESFRDAYRAVAGELASIDPNDYDVEAVIARRSSVGAPGNVDLPFAERGLEELRGDVARERERVDAAIERLAGESLPLYPGAPTEG
jgi:argininosuccinate lyase